MNPNSVLFLLTGDVKTLFKHHPVHSAARSRPSASHVIISVAVLAQQRHLHLWQPLGGKLGSQGLGGPGPGRW